MKHAVFALLSCFAVKAAEIPKDTHVLLRMMNSITTRTVTEGTQVYLRTTVPIAVNGAILVPVGSYVQGVVSHAKRSGRVSGRAELGIRLDSMTLPSGKMLKLSPRLSAVDAGGSDQKIGSEENIVKQGSDVGKDLTRVAIMVGSGAAVGGLADRSWSGAGIGAGAGGVVGFAAALLSRGREVELRQGSTLDVVFDRAVLVE